VERAQSALRCVEREAMLKEHGMLSDEEFARVSKIVWLCMSGVKLFPQWRQAVAFFPVIEPSGFLATVEPRSAFAQVTQRVAL